MKKVFSLLFIAAQFAFGQALPPSPQSRVAGRFVASNYGQWSLPVYKMPSGTGSQTFTLSNSTANLTDGRIIVPFNINAPIFVGTEKVTPTDVGSGCLANSHVIGGCSITATFTVAHTSADPVRSATYGLQEALNDAGLSGGGAVVIDSAWTNLGGTTAIVNAATLPMNTGIEDARTGTPDGGSPGGSTGQLQWNNANAFAGASGGTTNGTHFAFGAGSTINNSPTVTPEGVYPLTPTVVHTVSETYTGNDLENGQYIGITLNPSTATLNQSAFGLYDVLTAANNPNFTLANFMTGGSLAAVDEINSPNTVPLIFGGDAGVYINGTAEVTAAFGFSAESNLDTGATVDDIVSLAAFHQNWGSGGTITDLNLFQTVFSDNGTGNTTVNLNGIDVGAPILPVGNAITNNNGVYIEEQSGSGITNAHQIYSVGTAPSLIQGRMEFGDLVAPGILTLAQGNTNVTAAGGEGWQFNCSDCDTPLTEGATCTSAGDHAGTLAIALRGAIKCF